MTLFFPIKRATLHIPGTGPKHDPERGHLHVILTDQDENKQNLLVGICSYYDRCDKACILEKGHLFIKHKSFVFYAEADVVPADMLHNCVKENIITYEGLFDEPEFQRICNGLLKSAFIRPRVKKYYQAHLAKLAAAAK